MLKVVQLGRALATAVFGLFLTGAALAKALGAGVTLWTLLTAVALAGGLMALGLWWLEREAAWDEASDARLGRALGGLGELGARVGAVYQLEELAKNLPDRYHAIVYAVLNDYIREHARLGQDDTKDDEDRRPPATVQTALKVLARRDQAYDGDFVVRLSRADLRGASLRGARFDRVRLRSARLDYAKLEGASLQGAKLREAVLRHADFGPDRDSGQPAADLTDAELPDADLTHAKLRDATLKNADLTGATLTDADLRGANLEGARLERAALTGAKYNDATVPPAGFSLTTAGGVDDGKKGARQHSP